MSCQSCGGKPEEHPNQFCEQYTTELPYEKRPKYNDDSKVCCCDKKSVPTKGKVDFKMEKGFTMTKEMFWCKRCGLGLTFAQMDKLGDTWDVIDERNKNKEKEFLARRYDGGDPEAEDKKGLYNPLD